MKARSRKRIALALPQGLTFVENNIQGILAYAKQHAFWSFTRVPEWFGTSIEWLRNWRGDGAFALVVTQEDAKLAAQLDMPIVNLASHLPNLAVPSVTVDHIGIGQLAARHLLERNFRRLGYYGPACLQYSQLRRQGFCQAIEESGCECSTLEIHTVIPCRPKLDDQQRDLESWLRELKPPVGILASNDLRAKMVLEACQAAGLVVPDDVAVVGVDNDPIVCEFCEPPLTSVSRNDYQSGLEAAALLARLIAGETPPPIPIRVSPAGVVQRRSTDTVAIEDPYVADAIRFMRQHVHEHFGIEQILKAVPLSRRSLEYRFRSSLGRSPYDFLNQVRVDQAKRLLADPQRKSLTGIASACGFGDLRRFRIVFRRLVEASPAEYRQSALRIARGVSGNGVDAGAVSEPNRPRRSRRRTNHSR